MMRTVIYTKAGRIRVEREQKAGTNWILVTRLSFENTLEAIRKFPKLWKRDNIQIFEMGTMMPIVPPMFDHNEWAKMNDDLLCESQA